MAATAFLFDLDGTIWDSYPCYGAALGPALRCTSDDVVRRLHEGQNVVTLAGSAGVSNARFTTLCRAAIGDLALYPGVRETLIQLRGKNVPLGVVTNIPQRLIVPLLSDLRLDDYFGSVVCAARKPGPTGILRATAQLGVVADESVFFAGDSLTDARAAGQAGVSFAWAAYGYGIEPPAETPVILESFSGLLKLL